MTKDKRLVNKTWCPHFSSFTSKKSTLKYKARTTSNSGTNEIRQHLLRLNNPRFVNVVKPKLENRRVKSYLIYKFIRKNGVFTKYSKRVKLSEFKRWMNINKTNKVVGWTPDYVGSMPSLVTRAKNYITEAVSKCFTSIVSEVSIDMETDLIRSASNPRVVYSSGYDTVHSHIKEYFKDNTTDNFGRLIILLRF